MSLLMDALRKAEQQKQQGATGGTVPPVETAAAHLGLEPLPELPKRLEELDDQFFAADPALQKSIRALEESKARADAAQQSVPAAADRAAAQNVFAAKQPTLPNQHRFAIVTGVATLLAVAMIGGYFYWQMQPRGGLVGGPGLAAPPFPVALSDASPIVPAAVPEVTAIPPVPALAAAAVPPEMADHAPPVSADPAPPLQAGPPRMTELPDHGIRFSRATEKADTTLKTAHAAFLRGETELARTIWSRVLQADARNLDALHGLAALALLEDQPEQADALYRRVLELDPRNAAAHAGRLSIGMPVDVRRAESGLKRLLAEQPESAHLHFALGNLYMGESRWAEAQQAFFKAHVADPPNPDYLYNLAVSLDHLQQSGLAAQYYERALVAAHAQPAAFDAALAEGRLRMLRQ